ncbi:MAG TPA: UTP--glucose-1-phosphate uridylyltransferase GalU [Steroidobacteraceae bacterium]
MRLTPKSVIRTAVFPVAGRGTRFLPATKASPKEMLPVVDKPLIQYAVEEALAAGVTRLVFITGASKRAIEDHFDSDGELEQLLERQGKSDLLNQLRSVLPSYASCIYIRQPAPLGLGHAVLCAQPAVGAEPFFVHLADDLIRSEVACLAQMAKVYESKRASILGVQVVPKADTDKYGIVAVEADKSNTSRVRSIVEKPKPAVAPSNLAVVGRYVLAPAIFEHLERLGQGAGGEIQLTDGIAALMREEAVYAYRFSGKRYDCGSKLGYLQATVEYALSHPALGKDFRKYVKGLDVNSAEFREDSGQSLQKSAPEAAARAVAGRRSSRGKVNGATNDSGARTNAARSAPRRRTGRGAQA